MSEKQITHILNERPTGKSAKIFRMVKDVRVTALYRALSFNFSADLYELLTMSKIAKPESIDQSETWMLECLAFAGAVLLKRNPYSGGFKDRNG